MYGASVFFFGWEKDPPNFLRVESGERFVGLGNLGAWHFFCVFLGGGGWGWWNPLISTRIAIQNSTQNHWFFVWQTLLNLEKTHEHLAMKINKLLSLWLFFEHCCFWQYRWLFEVSKIQKLQKHIPWRFHCFGGRGSIKLFFVHPFLRRWSNLTNILPMGGSATN